jgi:peptidoglycan hydrolase-like protein with peptidoglycan-binding domain
VAALQRALGDDPEDVDGIYGVKTRDAVEAFQKANGLTPDGVAGPVTLAALGLLPSSPTTPPADAASPASNGLPTPAPTTTATAPTATPKITVLRTLRQGSTGVEVTALQLALGFGAGHADGIFGPDTEAALVAFQLASGLDPDGVAGPETLRALGLR